MWAGHSAVFWHKRSGVLMFSLVFPADMWTTASSGRNCTVPNCPNASKAHTLAGCNHREQGEGHSSLSKSAPWYPSWVESIFPSSGVVRVFSFVQVRFVQSHVYSKAPEVFCLWVQKNLSDIFSAALLILDQAYLCAPLARLVKVIEVAVTV